MKTLTNTNEIKKYFSKHSKATVKMFLALITSMLQLRTTCLYKCKDKLGGIKQNRKTKAMSHYKSIIRFFKMTGVKDFCESIFMLIVDIIGINSNMLILDRTNWKIGKKNINILTIGVLFHNCFIPLCWKQLDKRGNSNFKERWLLVEQFMRLWGKAGKEIAGMILVADREFIGTEWLLYLHKSSLYFVFRLKGNMYLYSKTGKKTPIEILC